jgi:hypothetical protein
LAGFGVDHWDRPSFLVEQRQQLFIERIDYSGIDQADVDRPKSPTILEDVTADEIEAVLVQSPLTLAQLFELLGRFVLAEEPEQAADRCRLWRLIGDSTRQSGIEQRQKDTFGALRRDIVIGSELFGANGAGAQIVARRFSGPGRRLEVVAPHSLALEPFAPRVAR